jgi:ADP-heptose:LPS heptosyltransferase
LDVDRAVKKLLVYRLGSLGDTLVSLPCLHLLQRTFPQSERRLLTNFPVHAKAPAAAAILGESGLVHGYLRYVVGTRSPGILLQLAREIRRFNPDMLVYLMPPRSRRAALRDKLFFKWAAGVKRIVGLPAPDVRSAPRVNPETSLYEAEFDRLARSIAEIGDAATKDPANWDLRLTASERQVARTALGDLAGKPLVVCGPGTKMQAKDWGQENWRELLRRVAASYRGYGFAIVGAQEDSSAGDFVLRELTGPKLNLCGRLTPRETAAVLEYGSIFLGPDSGPMHLAACVGVPCVIAFSARGLPGVWFPAGQNHKVVYHRVSCFGCNLDTCTIEARRCLSSITVDEMAAAVHDVLSRTNLTAGSIRISRDVEFS